VAAEQGLAEHLLEQPKAAALSVEHVVPAAELEDRPRLDHEQVVLGVGVQPEADVLADLHLLLLDEEQRLCLVRSGRRRADPVLVRDRLEDLLDEEAVRALDRLEDSARIAGDGAHGGILRGRLATVRRA
jgi:hypothetical protein